LTQQVHWLDFNKGILLLEMHGTKKRKTYSCLLLESFLNNACNNVLPRLRLLSAIIALTLPAVLPS
jgi:hypothetical protein